jgi:photosystem II stability/assembly factor-like uncharacterized protein
MRVIKLIIAIHLSIFSFTYSQDGWQHQWGGTPDFNAVSASSDSIAWYVGDANMAIRVTPYYKYWHQIGDEELTTLTTVYTPRDGLGETCYIGAANGSIFRISNFTDWEEVYTFQESGYGFINGIYFWNENDGIALGDPPLAPPGYSEYLILTTNDGGNTWEEVGEDNGVPSVTGSWGIRGWWDVVGDNIWYPVFSPQDSTTSTVILHSSDRGQNWVTLPVPDEFSEYNISITFSNENDGFISTDYPYLTSVSSDGGQTWSDPVQHEGYQIMHPKCAKGTQTIFAKNYGEIIRSDDWGATWYSQDQPSNAEVKNFDVLDENVVWAAGDNQLILKTTNGGGTGLSIVQDPSNPMVPTGITLEQNYPNPFNPDTKIKFKLEQSGPVRLSIFNVLGQEVRILVSNRKMNTGYYTELWNGKDNHGRYVPTGNYFYRIEQNGITQNKKMILLR